MDDMERRQALADFLRTRRERLSPADVNLPTGKRRRTPGLRREEVAQLAFIGTTWYVALEQGRDIHPSGQVLDSLAQALKLTPAERRHLFLLAQPQTSTGSPSQEEEIGSALKQAVIALDPHPAYVLGRRWDLLAWNRAAELVFDFSNIAPPHSRNFVWRSFTSPVLRMHRQWDKLAQSLIAQFRADSAKYPGDNWFSELIEDLEQTSTEFSKWWAQHDVKSVLDGQKLMDHPTLGPLEFEFVTLQTCDNPDQKVFIYTGSEQTASRLTALLANWRKE
jgi:transcriptional regulator with XRE-family HTH domain